jgi:hypothetical protein
MWAIPSCAFPGRMSRDHGLRAPTPEQTVVYAWSRTGALQSRCTRGTRPRADHPITGHGPMQQYLLQNRVEIPMLANTGAVFRHHVLEEVNRRTDSPQIRKFPRL